MVGNSMFAIQINNRLKDIKGCKDDFGGVSIIAIGDLFQLEPVMDSYVFKDLKNLDYAVLAPNLWRNNTLQCLNLMKSCVKEKASSSLSCLIGYVKVNTHTHRHCNNIEKIIQYVINNPIDAPHLFIQNAKVDEFNERVHNAALGNKYRIKAQDSVIGANSAELREKILQQIPNDPRKTKQLAWNLSC